MSICPGCKNAELVFSFKYLHLLFKLSYVVVVNSHYASGSTIGVGQIWNFFFLGVILNLHLQSLQPDALRRRQTIHQLLRQRGAAPPPP